MARPPSTTTTHLLVSLILFLLLSLSSSQSSHFKRTPPRFPTIFPRPNKPQSTPKQQQKQQQQQQQQEYKYETRYFEQRLDHFSFSDDLLTFQRRYLINAEHWVGPDHMGPIFLYCGNEGEIVWLAENTGLVWELAPQFWRHGHLP